MGRKNKKQKTRQESYDEFIGAINPIGVPQNKIVLGSCTSKVEQPKRFYNHLLSLDGQNMSELIQSKGKIYTRLQAGPLSALVPISVKEEQDIRTGFNGKKMSIFGPNSIWQQILSFLKWSYDETKSETVVHLFYHNELGWYPMVLPQKGYTRMTINDLPDHPKYEETMKRLDKRYHQPDSKGVQVGPKFGTVHHHCSSSAFQSGVDTNDEKTMDGIHITVGNLDKEKFSIHGRISCRGEFTEPRFEDWFEIPKTIIDVLPQEMHQQYLTHQLVQCPKTLTFPEWWKDNIIKVETSTRAFPTSAYNQHQGQGMYGCGWQQSGNHWQYHGYSQWFDKGLNNICKKYDITLPDMRETYDSIANDNCWEEMIDLLVFDRTKIKEAVRLIDKKMEVDGIAPLKKENLPVALPDNRTAIDITHLYEDNEEKGTCPNCQAVDIVILQIEGHKNNVKGSCGCWFEKSRWKPENKVDKEEIAAKARQIEFQAEVKAAYEEAGIEYDGNGTATLPGTPDKSEHGNNVAGYPNNDWSGY